MTTKIGLISDPHASPEPVAEALAIFQREGVSLVLCAGDIGGYGERLDETVALLQRHGVQAVQGNHEQWALRQEAFAGSAASRRYLAALPRYREMEIEGLRLYMVHAEPPERLMKGLRVYDQYGEENPVALAAWQRRLQGFPYQVLVLGHTHQVYALTLADTLVVNPGSCRFNHSCAILSLPQREVNWFALGGKPIEKLWNWGANLTDD